MPLNSTTHFVSPALSVTSRNERTDIPSPWLYLAGVGVLLIIAVQMLVMAQLAEHQVQRGIELRQGLIVDTPSRADPARVAADMRTQPATQSSADSLPGYVLR